MTITEIENESHWHQLRAGHIGASEIGALFTDGHPFTSRHAIWARMRGLLSGPEVNPLMEHGKDMEPLIAKWLARNYGIEVMKSNQYHEHPDYPWLGCTMDYYILHHEDGPAGLQIKNVLPWADGWSQTRAPDYVEFQVQQEMLVVNAARQRAGYTPFSRWFIGSMHGGNPEDCRLIERHPIPGVVKNIIERSKEFMDLVNAGGEPPIDDPKDASHIVAMFKAARIVEGETLDLSDISGQVEASIAAWQMAKIEEKRACDIKNMQKARILRHCLIIDADDVSGYMEAMTDYKTIYVKRSVDGKLSMDIKERKP